jgi:cytochrome c
MQDHGPPRDIGEGFTGETGSRHAGGYDDDWLQRENPCISMAYATLRRNDDNGPEGNVARNSGASPTNIRSITPMDSWEFNKIAGGVLGTLIFVFVIGLIAESVYDVEKPEKPGYVVEGVAEETATGGTAAPAVEATPDFGTELPKADVAAGEGISKRCLQCHIIAKGGANSTGPHLWGVVDRPRASISDFAYSSAMKAEHTPWTYEHLFHFLKSPQAYVPGTKMSFAGIRSAKDRLDLLAYLRTQADSPAPIPAPNPAAAAGAPANTPAAGTAAPATDATTPPGGTPAAPANGAAPATGTTPTTGATPAAGTPPAAPKSTH